MSSTWSSWFVDAFLHTPWFAASEHTHSQAELETQRETQRAKASSARTRRRCDDKLSSAQTEADRIGRQADSLTNEAELP